MAKDIQDDFIQSADELRTNFLIYSVIKEYDNKDNSCYFLYIWLVLNGLSAKGRKDRIHFRKMVLSEKIQSELLVDYGFFSSLTRSFAVQAEDGNLSVSKTKEAVDKVENSVDIRMPKGPEVEELFHMLGLPSISATDKSVVAASTNQDPQDSGAPQRKPSSGETAELVLPKGPQVEELFHMLGLPSISMSDRDVVGASTNQDPQSSGSSHRKPSSGERAEHIPPKGPQVEKLFHMPGHSSMMDKLDNIVENFFNQDPKSSGVSQQKPSSGESEEIFQSIDPLLKEFFHVMEVPPSISAITKYIPEAFTDDELQSAGESKQNPSLLFVPKGPILKEVFNGLKLPPTISGTLKYLAEAFTDQDPQSSGASKQKPCPGERGELLLPDELFHMLGFPPISATDKGVVTASANQHPQSSGASQQNSGERAELIPPKGPQLEGLFHMLGLPPISATDKSVGAASTNQDPQSSGSSHRKPSSRERAEVILERILEPGSWDVEGLQQLQQLYDVCVSPIEDLLPDEEEGGSVPSITILPHEFLFGVPFCCLQNGVGENKRYLVERFVISYAPSLLALRLLNQRLQYLRTKQGSRQTKVLAMGNALMNLPRIRELPKSGDEAKNVQMVFGPEHCRVALRGDATKQLMLQELQNVDILHVATHASPQNVEEEEPVGDYSMRGCMLLSSSDDTCDGVVRASEIASVDCKCQLVTLSCCETALGKVTGDGVVGLYRAFFAAGAASVVVTHWKIKDDITRMFMEHFYKEFKATGNVSGSLRSTMMYCIREKKIPPQQWAAFSLIGAAQ